MEEHIIDIEQSPRCFNSNKLGARSHYELLGVLVTGLLFLIISGILKQKALFMIITIALWGSYLAYCFYKEIHVLERFGITRNNIKQAFIIPTILFLLSLVSMIIYDLVLFEKINIGINILYLLALYPLWGCVQQLLIQTFCASNLDIMFEKKIVNKIYRWIVITIITAVLFGLVHGIENIYLTIGTFGLALVWTPVYLKYRNIIPLGLFHGWIGAFFYFMILERDPWHELVN
jgi:membrane protease YdiL (CAAX protease family)